MLSLLKKVNVAFVFENKPWAVWWYGRFGQWLFIVKHSIVCVCLSYSKQVLAEAMAVLNCYCPHESEGFTFFPQVSDSPFKASGACVTHPYNAVKLSSWRQ